MNTTEAAKTQTITIGTQTFQVEFADDCDMVWLTGARGGVYFLREFLVLEDDGLRQIISWKSGAPLRVQGNEVRVYIHGNVIEMA